MSSLLPEVITLKPAEDCSWSAPLTTSRPSRPALIALRCSKLSPSGPLPRTCNHIQKTHRGVESDVAGQDRERTAARIR
jgi:hypothetical protein